MADIAAQVVNFKTKKYIDRVLPMLEADLEEYEDQYEINILDNASGEKLDVFRRYKNCNVYKSDRNLGFGGGHNLLAQKTKANFLLILNPDLEFLEDHTVRRLATNLNSKVKVVGPKLLTSQGRPQPYDHSELKGLRAQIGLRAGHSYWKDRSVRAEVAWVSGAALLVERNAFREVGGFDPNLFLYKEEEDLCLRLRQCGYEVIYDPSVRLRHIGSVVASKSKYLANSTKYYIHKHFRNDLVRRGFSVLHHLLP